MEGRKKSPHVTELLFKNRISKNSKLKIFPSKITPYVLIDPEKELFVLKGKSSPEDTIKFFNLIFLGLKNYTLTGKNSLKVHISLTYFNSSTAKCLFDLMKLLRHLNSLGIKVTVSWYFEEDDEDMLEAGQDYSAVCKVPFNLVGMEPICSY